MNGYFRKMACRAVSLASLMLLLSTVLIVGCNKWSHNGDIDGQWQVMQVSYSGSPVSFPEGERFYYNFYLSTVQLGIVGRRPHGLEGNMNCSGENLKLEFPYVREDRIDARWKKLLVYWGVPESGEINARIRELTSSRLVFEFSDVVVECRKF